MANIKHLLDDIRKDKYCQEMRETFCNALIETNKAAEEMESTVKKIKNEIASVNATAEVIDARGGKETLGERLNEFDEQLDTSVKFKVVGEGVSVPPINGGSGVSYVHPATHPASMITGLSKVATSGLYSDLIGRPTRLSEFENDIEINGTTFRTLLGLRSTDFVIELDEENAKITTYGFGHGVGMSQYGANGMANKGYTFRDILNHYYQNTSIKSI